MAWPTKTLAALAASSNQDLPIRYFHDPDDTNPFVTIIDSNGRALAFGINTAALVGSNGLIAAEFETGEISATELAADAVVAGKIAADAIPDSAALVKIISPDAFVEATLVDVIADNAFTEAAVDALFAAGAIDAADRLKAASIGSDRIASKVIADDRLASFLVKEPGHVAGGRLDFAGAATGGVTVTIGAVTYLEADVPTVTDGEWTNGTSGNNSAVSLAAAINGDTRNAGGPSYAAVVVTDTVFVFALAVGTAGNVSASVTSGEPVVIENLIGGTAASVKQQAHILHVVTAAEVAVDTSAPSVLIPLPFDADYFSWQVLDSTGGVYATEITARGTVVAASSPVPAYFQLANNGAADVQAGDIIRLVVQS